MKPDLTLKLPVVINMKLLLIIYPYIIRQTGNENIKTYQGEAAILHQVPVTNLQGNVN